MDVLHLAEEHQTGFARARLRPAPRIRLVHFYVLGGERLCRSL